MKKEITKCICCNKQLIRSYGESVRDWVPRKYCSHACYHKHYVGPIHYNYKTGTKTRPDGYIRDSKTDEYIHRKIMKNKLGRSLDKNEVVHHINGNTSDNRIENMILLTNSEHRKLHVRTQRRNEYGDFKK